MTAPGDERDPLLEASRSMRDEALAFRAKFDVFIGKLNEAVADHNRTE